MFVIIISTFVWCVNSFMCEKKPFYKHSERCAIKFVFKKTKGYRRRWRSILIFKLISIFLKLKKFKTFHISSFAHHHRVHISAFFSWKLVAKYTNLVYLRFFHQNTSWIWMEFNKNEIIALFLNFILKNWHLFPFLFLVIGSCLSAKIIFWTCVEWCLSEISFFF